MNTYNISAMIEFAYRHSDGEVSIVNQCEAALEELSALIEAAQPSVQADGAWTCPKCNALYGGELPDNCIECGTPRR